MHTGQWLITDTGTTIKVFSPWFPRGADNAIFTYETIVANGSAELVVKVVTKSTETSGDGAVATATVGWANVTGSSFYTARYEGLNELVRFQYEIAKGSLLYRMLPPTWYNTAT